MKDKLLVIVILFLFFMVLFSVSSFAESDDKVITFNHPTTDVEITLTLPKGYGSDYKYFIIGLCVDDFSTGKFDDYYIFLSNEILKYRPYESTYQLFCDSAFFCKTFIRYSRNTKSIDFSKYSVSDLSRVDKSFSSSNFALDRYYFVYSNFDLKFENR